jgi:putative transposase
VNPHWKDLLEAHWDVPGAIDFTTIEVWTKPGLVTFYLLFVMEVATRRVHLAGCTTTPEQAWMKQVARNLTNSGDGFLLGTRYVLIDRDTKFCANFRSTLKSAGVKSVRLPPQSPDLKGYASHCTSLARFSVTSETRRRSDSLWPCTLAGGSAPGCSKRHSFLSL